MDDLGVPPLWKPPYGEVVPSKYQVPPICDDLMLKCVKTVRQNITWASKWLTYTCVRCVKNSGTPHRCPHYCLMAIKSGVIHHFYGQSQGLSSANVHSRGSSKKLVVGPVGPFGHSQYF